MTELKRMRDVCPNPSDAVRAMVMGLRTARQTSNFFVDMDVYSHVNSWSDKKICYGCAATCAIFESLNLWAGMGMREYAASRGRGNEEVDAAGVESLTGVAWTDLKRWESTIDALRLGDPGCIYRYYGVDLSKYVNIPNLPLLGNSYSEAELQKYEAFADALKTAGL